MFAIVVEWELLKDMTFNLINEQKFFSLRSNKKVHIAVILLLGIVAVFYFGSLSKNKETSLVNNVLAEKFEYLSKNGNSSCSQSFQTSIPSMPDNSRLQGSCCSPMSMHRYQEQVEGLKKYNSISDIPPDPYDIEAGLAKKLLSYYDLQLSPEEQKQYDYAMQNSDEKGPCCCKCWRWYVYGGLGKLLIREKGFTGEQVTQVWNLSDGCGGEGDHVQHT